MATECLIEPAQVGDIAAIQVVAQQSWQATYGQIFSQEFIDGFLSRAYSTEALRRSLANARSLFLLAKAGEQVVGFGQLGEGESRHSRSMELYRLYVAPAHWRQGIGAALLAAAEDWLKQRGVTGYHCFVHSQNEVGKRFYLKRGFVHDPAYDRDDEWSMWKEVSP